MTPARLRQLADDADARALALAESGDIDGAARLSALAEGYRAVAAKQEGLRPGKRSPTVEAPMMTGEHRAAISRGHGDSAPMAIARAAGKARSMTELARKLGVSPSFLSQVIAGKKVMPEDRAATFEKLTGKPWKV